MGVFVSNALGGPGSLNPAGIIAGFIAPKADIVAGVQAILGQFLGAVIVWLIYLPHWAVTENKGLKLARPLGTGFLNQWTLPYYRRTSFPILELAANR